MSMTDSIECRVRLWVPAETFDRYQFKVGESGGMPVIACTWILGSRGGIAEFITKERTNG